MIKYMSNTIVNERYKIDIYEGVYAKQLHVFTESVPKLGLSEVDGDLNTVTKDILDQGYHIANYTTTAQCIYINDQIRLEGFIGSFPRPAKTKINSAATTHEHCCQASFPLRFPRF